jgi:hypothetical protein
LNSGVLILKASFSNKNQCHRVPALRRIRIITVYDTDKNTLKPNLYVALTHYPVVNKNGRTITSSITNLDLHDISRASKTFGVNTFYVVTPLQDQQKLVERIVSHWITGTGAVYNPKRREALETICIKDSLKQVIEHIHGKCKIIPKTVVTCARFHDNSVTYKELRQIIKDGRPYLLIFGTAWGLSREIIQEADYILDPVTGNTDYNHLSVRSAAAVIFDRLVRL